MQYNELGQLREKFLGNNIDSVVYDYNIRGWLTGINKNYVGGTANHYFGMELGYDKATSIIGTTSYLHTAFNGNIAGEVWKSAGDGVGRKYDFTYDSLNRLAGAAYQDNKAGTWGITAMDFSVSNLKYDANGNILSMNQNGFKVGAPASPIDQLSYTYMNSGASNRLQQVIDAVNDTTTKLGDFHYNPATKTSTDYNYDGNGNLVLDNNKAIDSIIYNYLNLPQKVHMKGKGNILYTYDAAGQKLQKLTMDSTSRHSTTTLYLDGFVYQQSDTITNPGGGVDTLQFMGDEEGRARWAYHKFLGGSSAYGWEYDFFEKDHLGNERVILSQEKDTAQYLATMEAAYRNTENALFYNIPATSFARAAAPGYPIDHTVTNPNDSVIRVNGSGQKVGPAIILKVMSGDKVDIGVNYYYNNVTTTNGQSLSVSDIINELASGIVSATGAAHGSVSTLTGGSSPLQGALTSYLTSNNPTTSGKPNAYLNWILVDDQFAYVSSYPQSGALQVGASGTATGGVLQTPLGYTGIPITKSGYLYIYVSNATPGWDVFFDNLSVKTYAGPMLEENHYYPFGLSMAGISDKALKTNYAQNKHRYNGKELQNQEFSDGTGIEEFDYGQRFYDPQIGRFFNLDPAIGNYLSFSPYMYGANNPLRFVDIQGLGPGDRVKAAQNLKGRKYSQGTDNQGTELRTGNSDAATSVLDCSEFVCRVLAADGITNGVQAMSTKELAGFLDDDDKFIRSDNEPQPGDVFLWRDGNEGHTGIVVSYDKETGEVVTSEARGKKYKSGEFTRDISAFTGHAGWKGFFHPKNENSDKNSTENKSSKKDTPKKKPLDAKKIMDNAEKAIQSSQSAIQRDMQQSQEDWEAEKKQMKKDKLID